MSFKARSNFEFALINFNNSATKVYSPPFATSFDTFWQLKFKPTSKENPEYCSVYLVAIPSHEEGGKTSIWTNRATYSANIYIKHPETFLEIKKATLDTTKFSAIKPLRGWNRFCKKQLLPSDQIILGIEFDKTEFGTRDEKPIFPGNGKPFPDDLVTAWTDQLNKAEYADVEFIVQDKSIYANTAILTKRIVINVTDFHPDTFLEMLRFLYTNRVTFGPKDSPTSAVNLFKIADKYLIENLQQHAKVKLCRGVNINNAAEFLFSTAWQYDELRDHVMNYVVQNFQSVSKTEGFKIITSNTSKYPLFHDLLTEILHKFFDGDSDGIDSC
nr:13838_t:CDS:2 [Entrophospora candida]